MKIYVSAEIKHSGDGTKNAPFGTITEAAKIAEAGDEIIVAPGIYRESVQPVNGGNSETERIIYRSEKKGKAIITGAEPVQNWKHFEGEVWTARISNGVFGDYNPYTVTIKGDWYMNAGALHTGEIYLNGKAMYEAETLEEVLNPIVDKKSWDPAFTIYRWYTKQDGNHTVIYANFHGICPNEENVEMNVRRTCFHPEKTGVNYITLSGFVLKQAATQWAPPTAYQEGMVGPHWAKGWVIEDCEISDSRCCGISLGKYLQPNNENKWSATALKHGTQTERDAVCQAQYEGWNKENIGSHVVRRCHIFNCGQTGIVGHLGGVFSIIEDNHIHHINSRHNLMGFEVGGIKMHAAIDVVFRRNHIHHCSRGIWLDWQAQGTRVSQNLMHDNVPPFGTELVFTFDIGEDVFVEVSHGPTLIDNNFLLSPCSARLSTQGAAFVHNLIAGSFTAVGMGTDMNTVKYPAPRYTPYHIPHETAVAGFMTILHGDMRFYNNIFVQQEVREDFLEFEKKLEKQGASGILAAPNFVCGTKPYDGYPTSKEYLDGLCKPSGVALDGLDRYYSPLPVSTGGNVYFNGAVPYDKEKCCREEKGHKVYVALEETEEKYVLNTNIYKYLPDMEYPFISTEVLGEAFEPEQKFENPDGTPIFFSRDYYGEERHVNPIAGPIQYPSESEDARGTSHQRTAKNKKSIFAV